MIQIGDTGKIGRTVYYMEIMYKEEHWANSRFCDGIFEFLTQHIYIGYVTNQIKSKYGS